MLLAIDIGNSNIVAGFFQDSAMLTSWRFESERDRMPDEWWVVFQTLAFSESIPLSELDGAIVSSVVPRLTRKITAMIQQRLYLDPIVVNASIDVGIGINIDHPEEAGADRIVNAVAVQQRYRTPAIVVDFGTATTFDVVSENGDYVGGAIAPGVQLALEALTGRAAQLSAVALEIPAQAIGHNTIHSIQSGTFLGYLELVNGMLKRIREELGGDPVVVATGGLGELYTANSEYIDAYDPDLTLYGLELIHNHLSNGTA